MTIGRFSSRRATLGGFLAGEMPGARRYDRIAGYFRSSLLEVAGEALGAMADGALVRVDAAGRVTGDARAIGGAVRLSQ